MVSSHNMNIPDNLRVREGKETLGKGNEQERAKLKVTKKTSGKVLYHGTIRSIERRFELEGPMKAPLPILRREGRELSL